MGAGDKVNFGSVSNDLVLYADGLIDAQDNDIETTGDIGARYIAATNGLRLANSTALQSRNAADSAFFNLIYGSAGDAVVIGGTSNAMYLYSSGSFYFKSGVIRLDNAQGLQGRETGGSYRNLIKIGALDNIHRRISRQRAGSLR